MYKNTVKKGIPLYTSSLNKCTGVIPILKKKPTIKNENSIYNNFLLYIILNSFSVVLKKFIKIHSDDPKIKINCIKNKIINTELKNVTQYWKNKTFKKFFGKFLLNFSRLLKLPKFTIFL